MSLPSKVSIICPQCGNSFDTTIWLSVNATATPDLRESLMAGKLNILKCPACGCIFEPDSELVYHDVERRFMIRYLENPTDKLNAPSVEPDSYAGGFPDSYALRIVDTRNKLVEKIKIFEDGLDDRVIEAIKLYYLYGTKKIGWVDENSIFYLETLKDDDELVFLVREGELDPDKIKVPYANYQSVTDEIAQVIRLAEIPGWVVIDRMFAEHLLRRAGILPSGAGE